MIPEEKITKLEKQQAKIDALEQRLKRAKSQMNTEHRRKRDTATFTVGAMVLKALQDEELPDDSRRQFSQTVAYLMKRYAPKDTDVGRLNALRDIIHPLL